MLTKMGPMNVLVIIVGRPDESLRVSVAATETQGHVWAKKFQSKKICLTELETLGLLTAPQVAKAHESDFDKRSAMLTFHAVAEPEALIAAQFVLQKSIGSKFTS
jgi:hypothetical protein